jgi:hypothetical protein
MALADENEACDFLHIGSGWLESSSSAKPNPAAADEAAAVFLIVSRETNAAKAHVRSGHGRGCDRATPYAREVKRLQGVTRDEVAVAAENQGREPSMSKIRQADFESLSLGPGCPWHDKVDLHI